MNNLIVEINEAIEAGDVVIKRANNVLDYLNDAKLWGIFDMFSRRSLLSSIVKHSKLDNAQDAMEELKASLDRFNSELNDVKVSCKVNNVDFDGWIKFFDIFCDDFLVDLYTVSKISDSKNKISELIEKVKQTQQTLENNI